ncbi:MAG TPA: 50S ribosomal protein L5 [Moheibacter sp.]|nr:50S ribosomal protein L5 [Moheibacter sp.]
MSTTYKPRPQVKYKEEIVPALKEEFSYSSVMQVPRLEKIVLSQGLGGATADKKIVDYAVEEMSIIAGQKAVGTISKTDEAAFKLRKGMPIGAKVTLRGAQMYEFLDRLVSSALPRIRDFNGISGKGFDGRGNYNLGITEQIIFPEINIDRVKKIQGMNITFATSAKTDKEAKALLQKFGLPFKKDNK